jgi:hypothetical protein
MGRGGRGRGKATEKLRFSIGAQVVCQTENGWEPGTVVDHWYTQEGFAPNFFAPYQVQLDDEDGTLIYVPEDVPQLCRERVLAWWEKTFNAGGATPTASKVRAAAKGVDVDQRDYNGTTALAESARRGWGAVMRALLDLGASPATVDLQGRSPLHLAVAARGSTAEQVSSAVKALLEAGADPNVQDRDMETDQGSAGKRHRTALHYCAAWDYTAAAQLLLEAAADPGIADGQHKTPLHLAVDKGSSREMVSLLIKAGCDAALKAFHKTADEIAQRDRDSKMAKLLGAEPTHWPPPGLTLSDSPPGLTLSVDSKNARTFSMASTASTASSD